MPSASPSREPADGKRRRILAAARRLCARSGYEAATMEAIAAEARVSKGTLYNFFEGKEHLFLSTQVQAYEEADALVQARVAGAQDPRARLDALLEAMVEIFPLVAGGMSVNLQVWAVVSRDAEARARMYEELCRRYADTARELADTLRAGQRAGCFRSDLDAGAVAAGLAAIFDGFVYRSLFDPEHAHAPGLRRAFRTLVEERVASEGAR